MTVQIPNLATHEVYVTIGDSSLTWQVVAVLDDTAFLSSGLTGRMRREPLDNVRLHSVFQKPVATAGPEWMDTGAVPKHAARFSLSGAVSGAWLTVVDWVSHLLGWLRRFGRGLVPRVL